MKKIIIAGTAYPLRGAFAQLNAILYRYLSLKYKTKIYSFKRQYPEILFPGKTQLEKGSELFTINPEDKKQIIDSINPFNWILTGYKMRREDPGLIIFRYWMPFFAPCFAFISITAKLFSGTKIMFICDNVIPHEKRFGDNFLTKLAFLPVDYFVIHSKSVERDLLKFIKNKKYLYSPHPVYNNFGEKVSDEEADNFIFKEYGIDIRNENVILFFGYIRKYKGLSFLIEAMSSVLKEINVKLLIIGEPYEDEKEYTDKIKKLGLEKNIYYKFDFTPNDHVKYFFSACDAVVLPYISATQSGITQIAYYYDKPVIVTNAGGLSEVVVDNKTGIIVNKESVKELSDAIIRFYREGLNEKFTEEVRREKEKYSWETFISKLEEFAITESIKTN